MMFEIELQIINGNFGNQDALQKTCFWHVMYNSDTSKRGKGKEKIQVY